MKNVCGKLCSNMSDEQQNKTRILLRGAVLFTFVTIVIFSLLHMIFLTAEIADYKVNVIRSSKVKESTPPDINNSIDEIHQDEIESIVTEDKDFIKKDNPNFPQTRDWVNDHIYFSTYENGYVYTNDYTTRGQIKRRPFYSEKVLFNQINNKAIYHLKSEKNDINIVDCHSIRFRFIPGMGVEAETLCKDPNTKVLHRLTIFQPTSETQVVYHRELKEDPVINIITTITGKKDVFKRFLLNLEQLLKKSDYRLSLTVVYFKDGIEGEIQQELANLMSSKLDKEIILLDGNFDRALGLNTGVRNTSLKGEVIMLCDVDMLMTNEFLDKCLTSPDKGYQIFAPVVFSQYNPFFSKESLDNKFLLEDDYIKVNKGYWRVWGYGMMCLYKEDFFNIDGFKTFKYAWGGEDMNFIKTALKNSKYYKIIRSLEPGLLHVYHPKDCGSQTSKTTCNKSRAFAEGSQIDLALWYLNNKDKIK